MKTLITLVGIVLILEGLPYLTFPEAMQRWLVQLLELTPVQLRIMGFLAVASGLVLCYFTQRTEWLN